MRKSQKLVVVVKTPNRIPFENKHNIRFVLVRFGLFPLTSISFCFVFVWFRFCFVLVRFVLFGFVWFRFCFTWSRIRNRLTSAAQLEEGCRMGVERLMCSRRRP